MIHAVLRVLITAAAVLLSAQFVPGLRVRSYGSAVIFAVVLAVVTKLLHTLLVFLSFPLVLVTFGLFLLVINALIIMIAGSWVRGFVVDGFWWALIFSIILSLISSLLEKIVAHDESTRNH